MYSLCRHGVLTRNTQHGTHNTEPATRNPQPYGPSHTLGCTDKHLLQGVEGMLERRSTGVWL
jgi:hypothetical protein